MTKIEESIKPITVRRDLWLYAESERRGLCVCHEIRDADGHHVVTNVVNIPWWAIRRAMKAA